MPSNRAWLIWCAAIAACGPATPPPQPTAARAKPAAAPVGAGSGSAAAARTAPKIHIRRIEAAIPMRDGVKLNTEILVPEVGGGPQPMLLERTPYEAPASDAILEAPALQQRSWVKRGLIAVFQDIRGRFKSEGTFEMIRPPRTSTDPRATDETTDTYDTIEWLLHNVPNASGKVGMTGTSYDGWVIAQALLEPHPALQLAFLEGTPADSFFGDDFLHNGALRRMPTFEYVALMEGPGAKGLTPFEYPGSGTRPADAYAFHLGLGPLSAIDRLFFQGKRPTWNDVANHPTYDEFWKRRNVTGRYGAPKVRAVHVAGWYDVEDFYGSVTNYLALERKGDPSRLNQLVIGPWRHGDWQRGSQKPGSQKLGPFDFGVDPKEKYRELREALIDRYLYGRGPGDDTEAYVFETGSNRWRAFDQFPPPSKPTRFYTAAGRALVATAPTTDGADEYVADPSRPVPHAARPMRPFWEFAGGGLSDDYGLWRLADQRFASDRPDVAQWVTPPLDRDLTVAGSAAAHLFVTTTGTDCDLIVRLIDVYPDDAREMAGYQFLVAAEVMPARFRTGFERAVPTVPGKPFAIDIDLRWLAHRFGKGHRIMLAVQSSWFPLIERNPQTLVDPFKATEKDFRVATQRILRAPKLASNVELPVIDEPAR